MKYQKPEMKEVKVIRCPDGPQPKQTMCHKEGRKYDPEAGEEHKYYMPHEISAMRI